jgi:hypothetical protein
MTEQASTETKPKNAFIVRVNPGSKIALKHDVVGIGWSKLTEMSPSWSWGELKNKIREKYNKYSSERALGNVAGSIERFCMEGKRGCMSVDDYVLMPVGRGFHLGIVKSEVKRCDEEWSAKSHLQWQRDVEWLTKVTGPIPRDVAPKDLQNRLKIRQTCADVSDLLAEIQYAKANRTKEFFSIKAKNAARGAINEIVRTYLGNDQLEELIGKLCEKSGASNVRVLSKKNSKAGDADVQADYPVIVGNNKFWVRVLYQAKNHEGITGAHGINQLIARLEGESGKDSKILAYKGCLVTTANDVTDWAKELASETSDQSEIDIITQDDLADWILDAGLSDLNV